MSPPPRRVTSHDVAARAGVSQPTVSLVLGGNPHARVAPATRERVIRAAEELGYRPNLVARGLVRRRSYSLGVVVPDLSNPFYADVVSGVERVAVRAGYATLLCDTRETAAARHVEALVARQTDGIIIDAVGAASIPAASLEAMNVVLIDEPSQATPGVASDAEGAGRLAAEHLLGLGHRRLAFMGPAVDVYAFRMRERGYVAALREAGVRLSTERLRRAPPTVSGGVAAMRGLLATTPRPTAVFCANDLMALGALKACAAAGVPVPAEVSIVGCDGIELGELVTPELTTVAVPARELGARAARLLLQRMDGEAGGRHSARPVPVRLVARGTTAPPTEAGA